LIFLVLSRPGRGPPVSRFHVRLQGVPDQVPCGDPFFFVPEESKKKPSKVFYCFTTSKIQSYAVVETSFLHTGTSFNMLCLSTQKNINNKAQNKFLGFVVDVLGYKT
jgi:hypothetical protein